MVIKIVEKNNEYFSIEDLIDEIKKSQDIDEAGSICSFEGIVRGKDGGERLNKLILSLQDKKKGLDEIKSIVESSKIKHDVLEISLIHYIGEFYTGDSLFLVVVLGKHRKETLNALTEIIERVKHEINFKKEEFTNQGTKIIMAGG